MFALKSNQIFYVSSRSSKASMFCHVPSTSPTYLITIWAECQYFKTVNGKIDMDWTQIQRTPSILVLIQNKVQSQQTHYFNQKQNTEIYIYI